MTRIAASHRACFWKPLRIMYIASDTPDLIISDKFDTGELWANVEKFAYVCVGETSWIPPKLDNDYNGESYFLLSFAYICVMKNEVPAKSYHHEGDIKNWYHHKWNISLLKIRKLSHCKTIRNSCQVYNIRYYHSHTLQTNPRHHEEES